MAAFAALDQGSGTLEDAPVACAEREPSHLFGRPLGSQPSERLVAPAPADPSPKGSLRRPSDSCVARPARGAIRTRSFQEQDPDEDPKVGTLYVKKAASKRLRNPTRIRVTIEAIEP